MANLLLVSSTITNKTIIKLNRELCLDDFDIELVEPNSNKDECYGHVSSALIFSAKKDIIDDMLNIFKPVFGYDSCISHPSFSMFVHGDRRQNPKITPKRNIEYISNIEVAGRKGTKAYNKRFDEAYKAAMDATQSDLQPVKDAMLKRLQTALEKAIEGHNQEAKDTIKDFAVNINIHDQWFDEHLTENEKLVVHCNEQQAKLLRDQIKQMTEQLNTLEDSTYHVKRYRVEQSLKKQLCDVGIALLDTLKDVMPSKKFNLFN